MLQEAEVHCQLGEKKTGGMREVLSLIQDGSAANAKPDNLSLIPGAHVVERENQLPQVVL